MPLLSSALGSTAGRIEVTCDARWTMAYAAGVPDEQPGLYDTEHGLVVHPVFPVAPEWALMVASRNPATGLTADELRRGIHQAHDLVLARPLRADDTVTIDAVVSAVGRRRAGATYELLLTATDADGAVVWRTRNTSLFLGVELDGEPGAIDLDWPDAPGRPSGASAADAAPLASRTSFVRPVDAHVYSECARIWNPIHTDVVAARRAGLAAPILHGTATLARAVSIASDLVGWSPAEVARVAGRFAAAVDLGTSIEVRVLAATDTHLWFDVVLADRRQAITDGLIGRGPADG